MIYNATKILKLSTSSKKVWINFMHVVKFEEYANGSGTYIFLTENDSVIVDESPDIIEDLLKD